MGDRDDEIIRLLTEIRDAQREELEYRRLLAEQSLALQRRGILWQRIGIVIAVVMLACMAAVVAYQVLLEQLFL